MLLLEEFAPFIVQLLALDSDDKFAFVSSSLISSADHLLLFAHGVTRKAEKLLGINSVVRSDIMRAVYGCECSDVIANDAVTEQLRDSNLIAVPSQFAAYFLLRVLDIVQQNTFATQSVLHRTGIKLTSMPSAEKKLNRRKTSRHERTTTCSRSQLVLWDFV